MRLTAHRVNTVQRLRRVLPCSDAVEVDVVDRNGVLYATHDTWVRREPPGLLRERLAQLISSLHARRPVPLGRLLSLLPKGYTVILDPKTRRALELLGELVGAYAGRLTVYVSTRWHNAGCQLARWGAKVLLTVSSRPHNPAALVESACAMGVACEYSIVDRDLVADLHARGFEVVVWTVNTLETARAMALLGVDWVVTDKPCKLRSLLAGGRDGRGLRV